MEDILRILEKDARTPPERIAEMTGRSVEEVRALLRKAEEERTILAYRTQVDWERVDPGQAPVYAMVEVKITPQREVGFDSVAARIARFPEVRSMHLVSGDYDLAVQVVGKTIYEIATFVTDKLAVIDAVQGTSTHFILKRYKEEGVLLRGEDGASGRLPLSL